MICNYNKRDFTHLYKNKVLIHKKDMPVVNYRIKNPQVQSFQISNLKER